MGARACLSSQRRSWKGTLPSSWLRSSPVRRSPTGGSLARTGTDVAPWIAAGGALVVAGALLITAAARRRTA